MASNGDVTLVGQGTATVTAWSGNNKVTVCSITCTMQLKSAHFYQADSKWKFTKDVGSRACQISSFAIMLTNAGIKANPRTVYEANGSLGLNFARLSSKYNVKFVSALAPDSPYLQNFNGKISTVKDPGKNYVAALKEALDRNPEGVCLYFRSNGGHMIVAVGYIGNEIYYSDPGRNTKKGYMINFSGTWCYYKHKMSYKDLKYIVAMDKK